MNDAMIHAEGVVKHFKGGVRALDGLSLRVEPGSVFGLLGPNGAGKTTFIRALATLLRPDAGAIQVDGVDVLRDPESVRARIGLAGQFAAVDGHLTGRENIEMVGRLYGLSHRDARAGAADVLDRIRLSDAGDRLVKTYSGGMRRRIDLAASLVGRPKVLFLDEPTTGLDPAARRDLWELIKDLVDEGTTVLLTTQYLDEADHLADRIAVIDRGRVIVEGTSEELKERVGGAVLELSVPEPHRAAAITALDGIGGGPAVNPDGGAILLPAGDGVHALREVLARLDRDGIVPADVSLHRPTLDDVFLSLTRRDAGLREANR